VAELKIRISGELQVAGSHELVQTLMEHDLRRVPAVDGARHPGPRKAPVRGAAIPSGLRLLDTRTTTTSVTINTYERAAEVEYASWALDE
jgi:hypothetical protein